MPAYRDEKTGKFFASFYFTDYTGAKKKKMKRGFDRKRDAQDWERQFLMQQSANLNMTFGDFVEIYRRDKQDRLRESTWISKDNMINTKILPYLKQLMKPKCWELRALLFFLVNGKRKHKKKTIGSCSRPPVLYATTRKPRV